MEQKREYLIDNSKAILIFFVVFAHFLEFFEGEVSYFLQLIIYSFHMPVFVYFSGYLAKYDSKKMIKKILLPYLIVQIFGYFFYNFIGLAVDFRVVSPYASLWYMVSLFLWYLTIPFLERTDKYKKVILISVLIGLIIGYDQTAAACLSLSRTIVFFPFFVFEYYNKKYNFLNFERKKSLNKIVNLIMIFLLIASFGFFGKTINVQWFYNNASYASLNYNPLVRILIYFFALLWIFAFHYFVPKSKTFFTKVGKNSLSVYLLHYFIVYFIVTKKLLNFNLSPIISSFILTILIVFVLSRDKINKVFKH